MSSSAAARLMRIIGWISVISAVLFAWGSVGDPTGANHLFFTHASSGDAGLAGIATPEAKLALAIAGGLFGGLMGFYIFIAAPGIEQGHGMIRRGTILAFLTWFLIDSSASLGTGNVANVAINIAILTLYLAPVMLVRQPSNI